MPLDKRGQQLSCILHCTLIVSHKADELRQQPFRKGFAVGVLLCLRSLRRFTSLLLLDPSAAATPRRVTGIVRELLLFFFALLIVVLVFVALFLFCVTHCISVICCELIDKTLDCFTDILEIALGLLVPRFLLE